MSSIDRLIEIMARLRDPNEGCPWDIEQSFETIAPYTIEEAYEVAHAIERSDFDDLRDELGDLLLQVVYHAQMASEAGRFAFDDVVQAICDKLVRRHPHVFGEVDGQTSPEGGAPARWEALKAEEREQKAERRGSAGENDPLEDIPRAQPALMRARKLVSRATSEIGSAPLGVAEAEALELVTRYLDVPRSGADSSGIGMLLQACVRVAHAEGLDAEELLREANLMLEHRVRSAIRAARS